MSAQELLFTTLFLFIVLTNSLYLPCKNYKNSDTQLTLNKNNNWFRTLNYIKNRLLNISSQIKHKKCNYEKATIVRHFCLPENNIDVVFTRKSKHGNQIMPYNDRQRKQKKTLKQKDNIKKFSKKNKGKIGKISRKEFQSIFISGRRHKNNSELQNVPKNNKITMKMAPRKSKNRKNISTTPSFDIANLASTFFDSLTNSTSITFRDDTNLATMYNVFNSDDVMTIKSKGNTSFKTEDTNENLIDEKEEWTDVKL